MRGVLESDTFRDLLIDVDAEQKHQDAPEKVKKISRQNLAVHIRLSIELRIFEFKT
jgi:hypothetical protein